MQVIEAPNDYHGSPRPWLFLAGSIEMGKAKNWQAQIIELIKDAQGTILNPRRRDWNSSWLQSINNPQFKQQVEWELQAQEDADFILCYFDPATKSPITLLELGLFNDKMLVCCPEGFWRKGNVDIVCARYNTEQAPSIPDMVARVQWALEKSRRK